MREMVIYGVSFDMVGKQPIVLLKTADGNRFLPIWIGHPEAAAILVKLQNAAPARPMTHDLLNDVVGQLDAEVISIAVTEMRENTYYARITLQRNGSEIEIDSRPSDAIALAVRVRREDLRRGGGDRGVGRRVRKRRVGSRPRPWPRGAAARRPRSGRVPRLPRHRLAGRVRVRSGRELALLAARDFALAQIEQLRVDLPQPLG